MNTEPRFARHEAERELARGLSRALEEDFATAARHFDRARELLPGEHRSLRTSLVAFIDGQSRYHRAERELLEASRRFAATAAEQQCRVDDLQHLLSPYLAEAPTTPTVSVPPSVVHTPTFAAPRPAIAHLQISCFGRFAVRRGGVPIELCANRNGQTILRYLAAHPHHRETSDALMEALWPGDPPGRARHKLHCAISSLRHALNGDGAARKEVSYLICEGGTYALNLALPIRVDSDDFVAHYEAGRRARGYEAVVEYEAACRLVLGTFLPDDLYADWSVARRERLSQLLVTMCAAAAEHHAQAGQHNQAADWAQRILEENRCDEAAYQLLIRACALGGNRAEAIRQYERLKAVLTAELGVAPLPATTELYDAILRNELRPAPTSAVEPG